MSSKTTTYNVYRVWFTQKHGTDHEAILLVAAELKRQTMGRLYHVRGSVGLGMNYDHRPAFDLAKTKSYKNTVFEFKIQATDLDGFEKIAEKHPPPHDERVLFSKNLNPPARNCTNWVDDVLTEARALKIEERDSEGTEKVDEGSEKDNEGVLL